MRRFCLLLAITAIAFVLACANPAQPLKIETANTPVAIPTDDEAPRITLADAKKEFDAGTAVFIDARGADSYKDEHIKGAINISADTLDKSIKSIPKDKKIITYCS
jgi:3-mercaptopyruvate sulfurtransferase SseA